jgi:hypothetical protein
VNSSFPPNARRGRRAGAKPLSVLFVWRLEVCVIDHRLPFDDFDFQCAEIEFKFRLSLVRDLQFPIL